MNNPYRARPMRPRIDQTSVPNYGLQNNNIWPPKTGTQSETSPRLDGVYQPTQQPIMNQPQIFNVRDDNVGGGGEDDSWNWDNGNTEQNNDAWNWSIDQQQSVQLQPHNPLAFQKNDNNFNMNSSNRPAQTPARVPLTDNVSNVAPTSEVTSGHLMGQPSWSPVEQNKNFVHANATSNTFNNQSHLQNVNQQMVEKNMQPPAHIPARVPLTDNVSNIAPTSQVASSHLMGQQNWSPVDQNKNFVHQNAMSNQSHLQNVNQQMIEKNMQPPARVPLTDNVSNVAPTSQVASSHLMGQQSWSPVDQNKNFVHQNAMSNQSHLQNVNQQMVEKNMQPPAQIPARVPLTDHVSNIAPTSEMTSSHLIGQSNWSPVEQNKNFVHPNATSNTYNNQTHLQNVNQQTVEKNMQQSARIPLTDHVSKIPPTYELTSSHLVRQPNWSPTEQNKNFVHQNVMSNQSHLQNVDQQMIEKNMQQPAQMEIPFTDNASKVASTSDMPSSHLTHQPSWSPSEQNKNFVHSNVTSNTFSNQTHSQNIDQQMVEKNLQKNVHASNAHMEWSQPKLISNETNQQFNVNYQNLNTENSNKNHIENIQSRKMSLDDDKNQQLNKQPGNTTLDNVHSTVLPEENLHNQFKSSNSSQSWQSNTTQHSKHESNDNVLNPNSINSSKDFKKPELPFDATTLKPAVSQFNQATQLTNDIHGDSLNNTVEVSTSHSTINSEETMESRQNINTYTSITNQPSHYQQFNNYMPEQWASRHEIFDNEHDEFKNKSCPPPYDHSEASNASEFLQDQENTGVNDVNNSSKTPPTIGSGLFEPSTFESTKYVRSHHEPNHDPFDTIQRSTYESQNLPPYSFYPTPPYPAEGSNDAENLPDVNNQNTAIDSSVTNSFQSNSQYPIVNDNIPSTGFDQWYNQTESEARKNEWSHVQSQLGSKKLPVNSTAESLENIQTPIEIVRPSDISQQKIQDNSSSLTITDTNNQIESQSVATKTINNVQPALSYVNSADHQKQSTDDYEFASNDRNTFLETGELTDSHHESDSKAPSPDDTNDEVTNDIPFRREVPGQSSSTIPQRNSPTGGKQYNPLTLSLADLKRNEPFGHDIQQIRDVPSGQEGPENLTSRDNDVPERRDDPSGKARSLPMPPRNYPSNEMRNDLQNISQLQKKQKDSDNDNDSNGINTLDVNNTSSINHQGRSGIMTLNDNLNNNYERNRVVTGSQEININTIHDQTNDTRQKREEAVGASITENKIISTSPKRKNSYDDRDDDESGISQDELNRENQKETSRLNENRYDYDNRKINRNYHDREHDDYDDDYFDERNRRQYDDRSYHSRDDLDNSDIRYRDNERRLRENLERPLRADDIIVDEIERHYRRREERYNNNSQRDRQNNIRRQKDMPSREYDSRYSGTRQEYSDRGRRRDDKRRYYDDYDSREMRGGYLDDSYARSSRPSSRSSYNDRERDYYRTTTRDPYYNFGNYGYDYQANYMAYIENMRRQNPAAYTEWYNKYYRNQQQQQQHPHQQHQQFVNRDVTNYHDDRGSVHSGRSSCDDRTTNDKQTLGDLSLIEDTKSITRMTPTKFSTSHGQGTFSIGSLLHVHPSYPADGERARVDLISINNLLINDKVAQDLRAYPGPLIKGVTHKKTIIDYCETQIKKALVKDDLNDPASYVLIYQLMITLIQQNGNVVGVDIATLLLKNKELYPYNVNGYNQVLTRRESVISQRSSGTGGDGSIYKLGNEIETTIKSKKTIEQITEEFRNTLLYGLVQEALEYAMNEGLWGHALFLASKLDKRTHASVMARFANSLPAQDSLQTLYQLHSGRIPASVTCIADSKWDDWRPHLAMIISNTSANPEIDYRSIIILGDTLAARGDLYAAHFCYLLAQIDFGMYESSNNKLVLIGANHHSNYTEFANLESIMLTEIYEYARSLSDPGFTIDGLQSFKFEIVRKLIDYGFLKEAFLYLEQIAIKIINEPSKYKKSFINDVYTMSDRVKFHDPTYKDSADDMSLNWINNLQEIIQRFESNDEVNYEDNHHIQNQDANNYEIQHQHYQQQQQQQDEQHYQEEQQQQPQQQSQNQWNYPNNQLQYDNTAEPVMEASTTDMQQEQWISSSHANVQDTFNADQNIQSVNQSPEHNANQYNQWQYNQPVQADVDSRSEPTSEWNYEPQSQISMGPSRGKQYDPLEELDLLDKPKTNINTKNDNSTKNNDKQIDKKKSQTADGGSWFNGLFSKLSLKPKNQMILPDDNNPAIVWDSVAQKWKNKDDNDDSGSSNVAPPPPKAKNINLHQNSTSIIEQNTPIKNEPIEDHSAMINSSKIVSSGNMFKLQKGRSMRANYIDVMNPGGNKNNGSNLIVPTPATSPITPMASSSPQLFNPSPINNTNTPINFLTPGMMPIPNKENTTQEGNSNRHN
ncbi:hypothetical protein HCN44_008418 [Aphidius gifuensis]|uniref:Sec16 Sec23-binding domain-containing protein n=1 Tax=Aphidius gifuensis TaxID=684658 RepID=A0A835CMD1_APHGI|nr:putative uncharacterized protein DDB_G0282133 isoform X2 [Aphidius gifuensis]KAF7989744.1 hypothetical protein HCN44_008418 [Aphidius gifuensis]